MRNIRVNIPLSAEELQQIKSKAEEMHIPYITYIRMCALKECE